MTDFIYEDIQAKINGLRSKQIFFVVGMMKSGTTWIQLLLNHHPDISCSGEGHFTDCLARFLTKALNAYNAKIAYYNDTIFTEIDDYPLVNASHLNFLVASQISLLMAEQTQGRKVKCVGEKTPDHTMAMAYLKQLFPRAKFIHIVRDVRDVVVSAWFHYLRLNPAGLEQFGSIANFATKYAQKWMSENQYAVSFGQKYPNHYLRIFYEDLHSRFRQTLTSCFEFLHVEASDVIMNQCGDAANFKRVAKGRTSGTEDRQSHFRKGIVGDWHEHLDREAIANIQAQAGELLEKFGY